MPLLLCRLEGAAAGRKAYAGLYHFQALDPELDAVPRIQPPAITSYTDPRPQDGWEE